MTKEQLLQKLEKRFPYTREQILLSPIALSLSDVLTVLEEMGLLDKSEDKLTNILMNHGYIGPNGPQWRNESFHGNDELVRTKFVVNDRLYEISVWAGRYNETYFFNAREWVGGLAGWPKEICLIQNFKATSFLDAQKQVPKLFHEKTKTNTSVLSVLQTIEPLVPDKKERSET